ncbi:VEFS-Box domain-containing protein [Meloidogyne graminicola]|uniref:VEFS-Box domain-containing protein n=1 Tax=Meloidogyne graminicola TaxID=189291 RepID=A0A8S9ZDX5_9BILA|nr:VEFS-Box domain-containing protein [Meloidogyne graminicola]
MNSKICQYCRQQIDKSLKREVEITTFDPFIYVCNVNCDGRWIRDSYIQRFGQFTDLSLGEKLFFRYWNEFILEEINHHLSPYQMPMLLKRFIKEYRERMKKDDLFSNFVYHCAVLRDFNFISDNEMYTLLSLLLNKR